jgi:DNA segregation ATPase FtsK/SpoIIIE-like protein
LKTSLRFALGQDVAGNAVAADLIGMPHLLIAGATGSGKSVCVNTLICCLLLNNTPDDLRLVMVDPKRVELTGYNGVPHLLAPVVVEMERVVGALQWVLREMDGRYHKLAQAGCRNILDYNLKAAARSEKKRFDDAGSRRNGAHSHPPGPTGARYWHSPGDRHPAPLGGCGHRVDQSQFPGPRRLCRGLGSG